MYFFSLIVYTLVCTFHLKTSFIPRPRVIDKNLRTHSLVMLILRINSFLSSPLPRVCQVNVAVPGNLHRIGLNSIASGPVGYGIAKFYPVATIHKPTDL